MQELATTSVSVLRGETADEYGDVVDAATAAYENVPASIVEGMAKTVTDPSTQTPRTIRPITAVLPAWADVLNTDRLQDAAGTVYIIESVTAQPSLGYPPDTVLTLRRVTGAGT